MIVRVHMQLSMHPVPALDLDAHLIDTTLVWMTWGACMHTRMHISYVCSVLCPEKCNQGTSVCGGTIVGEVFANGICGKHD